MTDAPWKTIRSDDPQFHDARFQRRVIESHRPIEIVENMHDITLACGHSPLVFGLPGPKVGDLIFCPECSQIEEPEP
jgi:hypothetical protein